MKNRSTWIILLAVAVIVAMVFFLFYQNTATQRFDWSERYKTDKAQPYNTSLLFQLLKQRNQGKSFTQLGDRVRKELTSKEGANGGVYIFVGQTYFLTMADADTLTRFVEKGGTVFVSTKSYPFELMDFLYFDDCEDMPWQDLFSAEDTICALNFTHPQLVSAQPYQYQFKERKESQDYQWSFFDESYFCDFDIDYEDEDSIRSSFVSLGTMDVRGISHPNFMKVRYGKGNFYLHSTPLAFADIHLLKETGYEYAAKVLGHLPKGNIYWDFIANEDDYEREEPDRREQAATQKESPLKILLAQNELRWAWYGLLALALLYMLFRAKRRQRIVPVLDDNANTSLAFVQTIGRLYFQQNDHKKLATQKMRLFLLHLRERYRLNAKEPSVEISALVADRSGVPLDKVSSIFEQYKLIDYSHNVTAQDLLSFHKAVDYFYKNSK